MSKRIAINGFGRTPHKSLRDLTGQVGPKKV